MKTINLFVACPQESDSLKKHKEDIEQLCHKLNEQYEKKYIKKEIEEQVKIDPITYDNPERREEVCKKIIKHRADIVLFLFDNVPDECLLDELRTAAKRSKNFHKPEPLVFVKTHGSTTDDNSNSNLKTIKEALADGGWLYELFTNIDDLWPKVKYKIDRYVHSYQSIREIRRWSWWKYYGLHVGLPFFIALTIALFIAWMTAESKRILIVGGGSARNYIEKCLLTPPGGKAEAVKLVKYKPKLWWYAPMPSGDSYRIIAEDIINLEKNYRKSPYYPVVISAEKASNDSVFRKYSVKDFRKDAIIFGIHLGNDTLVVYGSDSVFDSTYIQQSTLNSLILDSTISSIWKTSDNSGTFKAYYSICPNLKDKEMEFFTDKTIIDDEKWIALGSEHYSPVNKSLGTASSSIVKGSDNKVLYKPIYLYFALYNNSGKYMLPRATKKFLKGIHVPKQIIDSIDSPSIISKLIEEDTTTILYDTYFSIK